MHQFDTSIPFMSWVAINKRLHVSSTRCNGCWTCFISLSTENYYSSAATATQRV